MEEMLAAMAAQKHLQIETSSQGGTAEELLQRTDNGQQVGDKLSWGSTGRANPEGYCQHATALWDPKHRSHSNRNELTGSL